MLGNFFKYFFLSIDAKNHRFLPNILLIYNLNVKQFGSQTNPHILWGFIWIQIVCIGYQRSSKFTASGLRVKNITGFEEINPESEDDTTTCVRIIINDEINSEITLE